MSLNNCTQALNEYNFLIMHDLNEKRLIINKKYLYIIDYRKDY